MKYSNDEVLQYVEEDDVKFIRLSFCDVFGKQKNISIMADELRRAFEYGIAFDGSSIKGFTDESKSDLILKPDSQTVSPLPWRPEHGKVIRMYSDILYPSEKTFECDTRSLLKKAIEDAKKEGITFYFGAEQEFYLFKLNEQGIPTTTPQDYASYMDIAPEDKGENVRREICLTLEQMGIDPESSHHEEGPGQNEIDFRYADALTTADHVMTFQTVVKTIAHQYGLHADFSAKPLIEHSGNGFHINISVQSTFDNDVLSKVISGILDKIAEMTIFLNPTPDSYKRFGSCKAPNYISWSCENRSQLIRIPAAKDNYKRAELRSPDPSCNVYLALTLLIYAGLDGIKNNLTLPKSTDINLFNAPKEILDQLEQLPNSFENAKQIAFDSEFIHQHLPISLIQAYCKN